MNTNTTERVLARYAESLEEETAYKRHIAQQLADIKGQLKRLVHAIPKDQDVEDAIFDGLVEAIYAAMGLSTWSVDQLRPRAQDSDAAGLALATALTMLGGDLTNVSIGKIIANRVKTELATSNGYLIARSGSMRGAVGWTVMKVST
jgi:hypothetical protein